MALFTTDCVTDFERMMLERDAALQRKMQLLMPESISPALLRQEIMKPAAVAEKKPNKVLLLL